MLTQIKLTNFKCFKEETTFPLSRFNLLTGTNGSGKSTLLQSLLLMRQSTENLFIDLVMYRIKDKTITEIILNGSCVNLGNFEDVKNRDISISEPILFSFKFDDRVKQKKSLIISFNETMALKFGSDFDINSHLELRTIHFISADRIGPQEFYRKSNLSKFIHVGTKGEFAVNLLDKLRDKLVNEQLCLGEDAKTLLTQTEAWLSKILSPMKVDVPRSKTNILELFLGDSKPANVGFGYSSVLPIIVSGLIARPDEKLIIENPEIHLHPKAQSALIQFLIAVANTGVQVFVESHSDHILNGVRVAVKEKQIDKNDVTILFHERSESKKDIKVNVIKLDKQGELSDYPENFFDEYSNQLFKLV